MIPIGATVDITNHGGRWRGVVTGRPGPYSIEIDGRLTAPANLAKVVGEMSDQNFMNLHVEAYAALIAERDALRELVVAQAATNAELAQRAEDVGDPKRWAQLQEIDDDFNRLRDAVRAHFANLFDTQNPTSMDCRAKGIDASDLIEEMARYEG